MDSKYSKYFENKDNIIIKRERRLIISKDPEPDKLNENEEEEEYWEEEEEFEDGGQTMEELDRLEQLETKMENLLNCYSRFSDQRFLNILFGKWKTISQSRNERVIEDIPNEAEEIFIEQILLNEPIKKEIDYPFIIKDWKFEDNPDLLNNKPKKKFDKINIINELTLSNNGIDINTPDYYYNSNDESNLYKNLIPNLVKLNQELPLLKIKRKEKIIEIEDASKEQEIICNKMKPNKPIKRKEYNNHDNVFKEDKINDDIKYINGIFSEKINQLIFDQKFDKCNINPKLEEIKDVEIKRDYYSNILDDKKLKEKLNDKLNIINIDYQLNIPLGKELDKESDIKNTTENTNPFNDTILNILSKEKIPIKDNNILNKEIIPPNIINPSLKQNPERICQIINIPEDKGNEILVEHLPPNNPFTKNFNPPFIYIDIENDNSDEITKKPKRKMDKINIVDTLSVSNNLDLSNTNHEININFISL